MEYKIREICPLYSFFHLCHSLQWIGVINGNGVCCQIWFSADGVLARLQLNVVTHNMQQYKSGVVMFNFMGNKCVWIF